MKKLLSLLILTALAGEIFCGDLIANRRRFRQEAAEKNFAYDYLAEKINSPDVEIARYAVTLLAQHHPTKAPAAFDRLPMPSDVLLAEAILIAIADLPKSETAALQKKLLAACDDPRLQVFSRVKLPYRMNLSLRNDPAYDHAVTVSNRIPLPLNGWKFTTDPEDEGFINNFFAAGFDDSKWRTISVTECWEQQGVGNYDGIAWYRVKFRMPPKMKCAGVDISFGAVDESSWVWLNGKYVGQHDIGPAGWNTPFYLNIASELKWGAENILTVRVKDTAAVGGIWKPVNVEVLQ